MPLTATTPKRRRAAPAEVAPRITYSHDRDYAQLRQAIRHSFGVYRAAQLFETNATGLYEAYIEHLPLDQQTHRCNTCRSFINHFGGLVCIDETGKTEAVMWNAPEVTPDFYKTALAKLRQMVRSAKVVRPFITDKPTLGTPKTGEWEHFAVNGAEVTAVGHLTPGQRAASKAHDFSTIKSALEEFTPEVVREALRILRGDHVNRADHFVAPAQWLMDIHTAHQRGYHRDNVIWRAVASAPDGFCHPRAGVLGQLMSDIAEGKAFEDMRRRFNAMVAPLAYQRPQAAPPAGNIAAAEALVAKLGIAPSFERRYARLDEVVTIWAQKAEAPKPKAGGVFAHLQPKEEYKTLPVAVPDSKMTWEKFQRTILPRARKMQVLIGNMCPLIALTTAAHEDAPPIIKWDRADARNPVAWYCYPGGTQAAQWGLKPGWVDVLAVVPLPPLWGSNPQPHLGEGYVLVLEGAQDSNGNVSAGLFPEIMSADLHEIRATIEAHSKSTTVQGRDSSQKASGYDLRKNTCRAHLRVWDDLGNADYQIDRWG